MLKVPVKACLHQQIGYSKSDDFSRVINVPCFRKGLLPQVWIEGYLENLLKRDRNISYLTLDSMT